jgi:hypothetical protein
VEALIADIESEKWSASKKAQRIAAIVSSEAAKNGLSAEQRIAALEAVWKSYGIDLNLDPDSLVAKQQGEQYGVRLDANGLIDVAGAVDPAPSSTSGQGSTIGKIIAAIGTVAGIAGINSSDGGSGATNTTAGVGRGGNPESTTYIDPVTGLPTPVNPNDNATATQPQTPTEILSDITVDGSSNANTPVRASQATTTQNDVNTPVQVPPNTTTDAGTNTGSATTIGNATTISDGTPGGNVDPNAARNAEVLAEVDGIIGNGDLTDQQRIDQINQVAESKGIDMGSLITIAGASILGAGLVNIFSSSGSGSGSGSETGNGAGSQNTGGNTTNTGGDGSPSTTETVIGTIGSLLGAWLGYRAAGDAADAQTNAANRALDIFEANAITATGRINETTNTALSTVTTGATDARKNITDSSTSARDTLVQGGTMARGDITTARNNSTATLLAAFGLQKQEINSTALASSALISAAREASASAIMAGYSDGISGIESARDLSNQIIQESTDSAEEKIDVARAGAIAAQDRGVEAIRSDFQPYLDAGKVTVEGLEKLINDPETQRDFILNNPFFDEFANQAERRLLANQAAKGRVAAGETSKELRNQLLEYGNQLLNTAISQRQVLVNTGMNAAASVGNAELVRANAVSGIEQAAGQSLSQLVQTAGINKANIATNAGRDISELSVGRGKDLATIETQSARDLAQIETDRGTNITNLTGTNATQTANIENTAGANLATIATSSADKIANSFTGEGVNLANINTGEASANAELEANRGINEANILTGNAANTADVTLGSGNAEAAGIIGQSNQLKNGLLDLTTIALNR